MSLFFRAILLMIFALLLGGCASKQLWYKAGKTQVDYDRDAQECKIIAKEFARQATVSGTSEDSLAYQNILQRCLTGKGWSMMAPAPAAREESRDLTLDREMTVASSNGRSVQAFGAEIVLPEQFILAKTSRNDVGPSLLQSYLYRGPGDTFITVMAQKAIAKSTHFESTPYPVQPPFFLYEQGAIENGGMKSPWTIFCGKIKGDWVMGLGSYFMINNKERITLIVTRSLMAQETEPKPGFHLSPEQFATVDAFEKDWLSWIEESVVVPSPSLWSRFRSTW